MIYTFKSRAAADLKMTGPVGDRVLSLIGKGPSAQGIVDVDQLPEAIRALEAAVEAEGASAAGENAEADAAPRAGGMGDDHVSLRRRVWPLLEMLRRAQAQGQPVVWGV